MRNYRFELESTPYDAETLASFHCVVIGTNHDIFDYGLLAEHAIAVVDARGVFRQPTEKVIAA